MTKILALVFCLLITPLLCSAQVDTIHLRRDFANPLVRSECVSAHIVGDSEVVIDSLIPQSFVSRCEGYQGAIAFVRDTEVSEINIFYLNDLILRDRPDFIMMCGMKPKGPRPVLCSWHR